jgi:hypothetical protein
MKLATDIEDRQTQMVRANSRIATISGELELEIPNNIVNIFARNSLKSDSIAVVSQYGDDLEKLKQERLAQLSEMANQITILWRLLDVNDRDRQSFLDSHATLSATVIESCAYEIERLRNLRRKRLPAIILAQNQKISELRKCFRSSPDSRFASQNDDLESVFEANEAELAQLQEMYQKSEPIIQVINEREEMLNELSAYQQETAKSQGKGGKPLDPKKKSKERRLKSLLPRLEKKLLVLLIGFKEENGEDFMWNGVPYSESLKHIMLSDVEKKAAKNQVKRKTSAGAPDLASQKSGRRNSENRQLSIKLD